MLTVLAALVRVIVGFVLACLAAGYVQVLFAVTPTELVQAGDERLGEAAFWGLQTTTQIAVFAAPFALISAILSEWVSLRSFAYHALVAMAIAVAGFGLIHAGESATEASIVNSYAMAAYLTSGFVGGFFYWLVAGRLANRSRTSIVRMEAEPRSRAQASAKADAKPGSGSGSGSTPGSTPGSAPSPARSPTAGGLPSIPKAGGSGSA